MRSATGGRWIAALAAICLVVLGVSATTPSAAQETDDGTLGIQMDVSGGVDGLFRPGRPVPIDIELEADQLVSAVLEVRSVVGSQTIRYRSDIEVPASSVKRFVVAMPTPSFESPTIVVSVLIDGETIDRQRVDLDDRADVEFVGVLPLVASADDLPPSTELAVDAGTAILELISPELLGTGFDGLWIFDSIVTTAADLEALSGREMDAIVAWTSAGGHLLVDEIGGPVPRVPAQWQPAPNHAARAGRGLVRLIEGQAKAGNWDVFLLPTSIDDSQSAGDLDIHRFLGEVPGQLSNELSRDAGFTLPPITDLLALFAVYALVAGPVSYLILRRRNRTAALWLTVPAFAVITTVGVWFVGSELRGNTTAAHATVVVTAEGVDYGTTHVLVDRTVEGIRTSREWTPTGRTGSAAFEGDSATLDVRPTQTGHEATFDLSTGEFSISSARGTLEVDGLVVSASSAANGTIEGEVRNGSAVTVHHVTVLSGAAGLDLGTLSAGEERSFTLGDVDRLEFQLIEWEAWGDQIFGDVDLTTGLWNASLLERGGVNATGLGVLTAVGWTTELDAPVETLDGATIDAGHTLLVTDAPITAAGDMVSNMTVRVQLVRGPAETEGGDDFGNTIGGVYQFVTPDDFDDGPITVHVPRFVSDIEIWRDGRWRAVPGRSGDERDVEISGDALTIDGVLHLRVVVDTSQVFEFGNGDIVSVFQEAR